MTAPDLDPGFRRFYLMWFVSHETMAHTAWRGDTLFDAGTCFAGDDEEEVSSAWLSWLIVLISDCRLTLSWAAHAV